MMMVMQPGLDDITKQRMLQARALCQEARGEGVNIGKKSSVPNDVMLEELNLLSNRGSRMFQERQKRVERFTLEKLAKDANNTTAVRPEAVPPPQISAETQGGKENRAFSIPGKHSLLMNLQKTVAKKGSPDVLAPGYSGPLKEIPHERFNTTVIPKSYSSPWSKAVGDDTELLDALSSHLPQLPPTQPPSSRCFNRSAMPFAGAMASERVIPVLGFVAMESQNAPSIALDRMCPRPNFNRAPRGWGINYNPESNEL